MAKKTQAEFYEAILKRLDAADAREAELTALIKRAGGGPTIVEPMERNIFTDGARGANIFGAEKLTRGAGTFEFDAPVEKTRTLKQRDEDTHDDEVAQRIANIRKYGTAHPSPSQIRAGSK